MVRIGIVGVGFMGMIHYLATKNLKNAQVMAICVVVCDLPQHMELTR